MSVFQATSITRGKNWLNTLLACIATRPAAALLATAKLRLLKSRVVTLSENTTRAELAAEEADFTDYPAGGMTVTPPAPVNYNALGQGLLYGGTFTMTTDPAVTGNDIAGYWIDDGTNMVLAEYFPIGEEVPMQQFGDWLELDLADALYFVQPV